MCIRDRGSSAVVGKEIELKRNGVGMTLSAEAIIGMATLFAMFIFAAWKRDTVAVWIKPGKRRLMKSENDRAVVVAAEVLVQYPEWLTDVLHRRDQHSQCVQTG